MRKSGILLAITSIPSEYGIGGFSKEAYDFVDFLKKAGQKYWQVLPFGTTGYGDSPYQSFSTYAGNPYFIDLESLIEEGLLEKSECDKKDFGACRTKVDYEKIYNVKNNLLYKAFERSKKTSKQEEFEKENDWWLEDYALYMAVKKYYGGASLFEWDKEVRLRKNIEKYKKMLKKDIEYYKFEQYVFIKQWNKLKKYANDNGIEIIGDIPIYVAGDSADCWANPELFQLDENGMLERVAGFPPDGFSPTGQLWGNPLYNWLEHKKQNFKWWVDRIRYCFKLYDVVRIDHFIGFDSYYSIPADEDTAKNGRWEKGPGYALFEEIKRQLPNQRIIAEDLGIVTDSVRELMKKTGYPGMKILSNGFNADCDNEFLPHNYTNNYVVYTGNHDNDTMLGVYKQFSKKDRQFCDEYVGIEESDTDKEKVFKIIKTAYASVCDTVIIPMQDLLALGSEARMNIPSTLGGNWTWRMEKKDCDDKLALKLNKLTKIYAR